MRLGIYKGNDVKVYDTGSEFIVEFSNGATIALSDDSEIKYN